MADWRDMERTDSWSVEMVDPSDLTGSRGFLGEGMVTELALTLAYDTETKASAKVTTLGDDGYVRGSALRIWHEVEEWGYREAVFTGYVTGTSERVANGVRRTGYELGSSLWAIREDLWPAPFSVAMGGTVMGGVRSVLDQCSRPWVRLAGAPDARFTSTRTWGVGTSRLTTLLDLAKVAGAYVSVDGLGRVTVGPSCFTSALDAPRWELDTDDEMSVTLSGDMTHSVTPSDAPGRYIVTHKSGSSMTVGVADVAASRQTSQAVRGYVIARSSEANELAGGAPQARRLAAQLLSQAQSYEEEWGLSTTYAPYREGDVVSLALWGERHVGFVKEADMDLLAGSAKLTIGGLS